MEGNDVIMSIYTAFETRSNPRYLVEASVKEINLRKKLVQEETMVSALGLNEKVLLWCIVQRINDGQENPRWRGRSWSGNKHLVEMTHLGPRSTRYAMEVLEVGGCIRRWNDDTGTRCFLVCGIHYDGQIDYAAIAELKEKRKKKREAKKKDGSDQPNAVRRKVRVEATSEVSPIDPSSELGMVMHEATSATHDAGERVKNTSARPMVPGPDVFEYDPDKRASEKARWTARIVEFGELPSAQYQVPSAPDPHVLPLEERGRYEGPFAALAEE
jgi:hypothetical protein